MLIEASNVACPTMVERAEGKNSSSSNVVALMCYFQFLLQTKQNITA